MLKCFVKKLFGLLFVATCYFCSGFGLQTTEKIRQHCSLDDCENLKGSLCLIFGT